MLRLGIIGMSPGNGHPFSWSAICNGYDPAAMVDCGFPVISDYLEAQNWPMARLPNVQVTHIWTQDPALSQKVATAALIENVVSTPEGMISEIDALLLARDDAENHLRYVRPFLEAGVPVYIDKPIALTLDAFDRLMALERYPGQIFSCSALRYADEFCLKHDAREEIGILRMIVGNIPNHWDTYAVHLIDPMVSIVGHEGVLEVLTADTVGADGRHLRLRREGGLIFDITTYGGNTAGPLGIRVHGEKGWKELTLADTFAAFRATLADFVEGVRTLTVRTDPAVNRRVVEIIEKGRAG